MNRRNLLRLSFCILLTAGLISLPLSAHAQTNDTELIAQYIVSADTEIDISELGWESTRAMDAIENVLSSPTHYSSIELADIKSCTLWSNDDIADKIEVEHITTGEELDSLHTQLEEKLSTISDLALHIKDDRQRAWALLRVLAETTTYDKDKTLSHYAYGALITREADCAGISTAYKLLCNRCNLDCDVVSGVVYDDDNISYSHAWNVLYLDGQELYLDVTFSRTIDGKAADTWFLLTKEEMQAQRHYLNADMESLNYE